MGIQITIACECGNKVVLPVESKKYIQFRDSLETRQFYYDGVGISDGKLKEIRIKCDKCKNMIILGGD